MELATPLNLSAILEKPIVTPAKKVVIVLQMAYNEFPKL